MKIVSAFLLLCFLLIAQSAMSSEDSEPPVSKGNIKPQQAAKTPKQTMDGVSVLMGVYSPFDDEMKGIYGNAFIMSAQYCFNMSGLVDLIASIGFSKNDGSPYYDVSSFSSDKISKFRIIPMEISLRYRLIFMRDQYEFISRGLYGGIGINYIRAREEVKGSLLASGGDFGTQIFIGPQIFITNKLAFEGEVKMLMNKVDMRYKDNTYPLTLSGLVIRAALSWYY